MNLSLYTFPIIEHLLVELKKYYDVKHLLSYYLLFPFLFSCFFFIFMNILTSALANGLLKSKHFFF